jgi:hypothetical protein
MFCISSARVALERRPIGKNQALKGNAADRFAAMRNLGQLPFATEGAPRCNYLVVSVMLLSTWSSAPVSM